MEHREAPPLGYQRQELFSHKLGYLHDKSSIETEEPINDTLDTEEDEFETNEDQAQRINTLPKGIIKRMPTFIPKAFIPDSKVFERFCFSDDKEDCRRIRGNNPFKFANSTNKHFLTNNKEFFIDKTITIEDIKKNSRMARNNYFNT